MPVAVLVAFWVVGVFVWTALVYGLRRATGRQWEEWPSYQLAWVVLGAAPPLLAPLLAMAPVTPLQIDAALALLHWTEGAQLSAESNSGALAALVGVLFCFGLLHRALLTVQNLMRARRTVELARPAPFPCAKAKLLVSESATSIFCFAGSQPAIVLPKQAVESMSPAQVELVVRHELAHLHRRDPLLFAALGWLDAIFWFSPFMRRLTEHARLAAEIDCDAAALSGFDADRRAYAETLVQAYASSAGWSNSVATFGPREAPRVRIAHILDGGVRGAARGASLLLVAAALLVSACGAALAAPTARMAVLGDAGLAAALGARLAGLYSPAECLPSQVSRGGF